MIFFNNEIKCSYASIDAEAEAQLFQKMIYLFILANI
jgi:hypothetical protein